MTSDICRWHRAPRPAQARDVGHVLHRSRVSERSYSDGSVVVDYGNGHTMQTYDNC